MRRAYREDIQDDHCRAEQPLRDDRWGVLVHCHEAALQEGLELLAEVVLGDQRVPCGRSSG